VTRALTTLTLLAALAACKQRGTIDIGIDIPDTCEPATHVAVYLIRGGLCGECTCGECLSACAGGSCTLGCDGSYCTIDEFADGITIRAERAGTYAVVYQLVSMDADGAHEVALACADGVQLENDGTASASIEATATCCPLPSADPDAGTSDASPPDAP
jgi:hypothetical protein